MIFSLIYAINAGLGKVLLKKSQKDFPPSVSFFLESLFGIILWIPYGVSTGIHLNEILSSFHIVMLGAILSEAYIFYIYSKGDVGIIATVFSTFSIYTIMFSYIILGERLTIEELVAIAIVLGGVLTISYPKKEKHFFSHITPILWATSGAIAVGFADTLGKSVVDDISAGSFLFSLAFAQIPVSIAYLYLERQSPTLLFKIKSEFPKYKYSIFAGLLIGIAQLFFWLGFEHELASIASPVSTSNAMFTVIFSFFILHERLSKREYTGATLVLVGVILLSIIS